MPVTFPSNPTDGQVFNQGNRSWTYSAAKEAWLGGQVTSAANAQISEANALAYANTAGVYAANAAASAVDALNVIAAQFKGGAAGGAVPATSTAAGDYYWIISAGTSQGKTWAVGDRAIYNGTSGDWTRQVGVYPTQQTSAGIIGLAFGTLLAGMTVIDNSSYAFGIDDIGITLRVTLPSYTPASNTVLFSKTTGENTGIRITLLSTGVLRAQLGNGSNLTTYQYDTTTTISTIVANGQTAWIDIELVRNGNMTVVVNGISLGSAVNISASSAQSITSSGVLNVFSNGTTHHAGVFHALYIRNVALTIGEKLILYTVGPSALPHYRRGTANIVPARSSVFNQSVTDWFPFNNQTTVTPDAVNGELDIVNITTDGAAARFDLTAVGTQNEIAVAGQRVRTSFTVRNYTGPSIGTSACDFIGASGNVNADGDYSINGTLTSSSNYITALRLPLGVSYSIANFRITFFGFVGIFEASDCTGSNIIFDKSYNNVHGTLGTNASQIPNITAYDALMATWPSMVNLLTGNITASTTGSGSTSFSAGSHWTLATGATVNSTARIRLTSNMAISNRYVESGSMIDYAGIVAAGFAYIGIPQSGDNGDVRIAFRESSESVGPLLARGIGFRMNGVAVYGIYHNGLGSEVSVLLNPNIGGTRRHMLAFISQKGVIQFFHQGVCRAVVFDGPNQFSGSGHLLVFEGSNGTVASNRTFSLQSANGFSIFP